MSGAGVKHFMVEATYVAPFEEVRAAYPRHRAWLQKGYDAGLFLYSGPKIPPTGGFLVARAESAQALRTMFETAYDGESPIADPDLAMTEPTKYDAMSGPRLQGFKFQANLLEALYAEASEKLVEKWIAEHP